jgi:hypothetical protein
MLTDEHGHLIHVGPCSGYPASYEVPKVICGNCASPVRAAALHRHHEVCTPEAPQIPARVAKPKPRCRTCTLYHKAGKPQCPGLASRWPLEPFLAEAWRRGADKPSVHSVEMFLEYPTRTLSRYAVDGFPDEQADRFACRLGLHPSLIWPSWFDAVSDPLAEQFLSTGWRTAWLYDHPDPQPIPQGQEAAA